MNAFVPKELPKARGRRTEWSKIAFVVCVFAIAFSGGGREMNLQNACCTCAGVACAVEALAAAEVAARLLSLAEERHHLAGRYRGSYRHLLTKLFAFPLPVVLLCAVTVCAHVVLMGYKVESFCSKLQLLYIFIGWFLLDLVNIRRSSIADSVYLDSLKGLDYGSGIAQSFFYGYLRLCLPDTGDQEKGLVERIEDYISQQKLSPDSFPVKRLFILIPISSYIPSNFKDASDGWMKEQGSLPNQERSRAGVIRRVYKNTVYTIKDPHNDDDEAIYVVAEGATPCKTLHEVIQYSGTRKGLYTDHQNEILLNFYLTLVETLKEHLNCSHLCEFIYYIDRDENGKEVNIALLIKKRILEIKEDERSTREQQRRQWQGRAP